MKVENLKPSHIVANVVIFWGAFDLFLAIFSFKKKRICNRIFLFKDIFQRMVKIGHQKTLSGRLMLWLNFSFLF